jgi:hypothetical protein
VSVRSAASLERGLPAPHAAAKAKEFRDGSPHRFRDSQLAATDRNGKLATIPGRRARGERAAASKPLRAVGEKVMGVHRDAWLPKYDPKPFRSHAGKSPDFP